MIDEGYIKYRCQWIKAEDPLAPFLPDTAPHLITELSAYRNALHQLDLIGEYPNGIGFGNLSQRLSQRLPSAQRSAPSSSPAFVITGTQTGRLTTLTAADYAVVSAFNAEQNTLTCHGLRKASSESLTHGIIYASQPAINAIVHVHSAQLWQRLLHQVPTTRADVPYGTPAMAAETQRLFRESPLLQQKILAMAGHDDGIVTFGENLQTAYQVLINWSLRVGQMAQPDAEFALQLPDQRA
ncbi:MAG: class II aldolase/adducin family protein [Phormidesmis sp.]